MISIAPQISPLQLLLSISLLLLGSCAATPTKKGDGPGSAPETESVEWLEPGVTTKEDVLLHLRKIAETDPDNED